LTISPAIGYVLDLIEGFMWLFIVYIWLAGQCSWAEPIAAPKDELCDESLDSSTLEPLEAFQQARNAYLLGCHEASIGRFANLAARLKGIKEKEELYLRSLTFLGEVHYTLGDKESSLRAFDEALALNPDYQISILDHDPDAVALFELARVMVKKAPPPPLPPLPRLKALPVSGYLPFGIPQFAQERIGSGLLLGGIQLATAATSIGMYVYLSRNYQPDYSRAETREVNLIRFGVQWPVTVGFWATYLASHLQARKTWKQRRQVDAVSVGFDKNRIWVSGRF
jgi:tetratricopeptide (TPR) repeat protein